MREILFRGKRANGAGWVFGYYAIIGDKHAIIKKEMDTYFSCDHNYEKRTGSEVIQVLPQTVGQFTGFYDKNGFRIFDGDILRSRYDEDNPDDVSYELVQWEGNGWYSGKWNIEDDLRQDMLSEYSELAGNIHDNPELMEVEE